MSELEKSASLDPLLKDLSEKKQSFRRNLVSLAADLNAARSQLASQEESFARESLTRQVAEMRVRSMEEEIWRLERSLEERNWQLQVSTSTAEQYLKELGSLRSQLSVTQATADANAASAQSVELQCMALSKELDEKNGSLKEQEVQVNKLGAQLDHLQKNLQSREIAQKQLQEEVVRIEREIMNAFAKAGASKDFELRKILGELSSKKFETINKQLRAKDEEIARLRDEIKFMSANWKQKTKELETELEKLRRPDLELKKRVLKLEFCLQEARSQALKLQRMGETRDEALEELRDQLAIKQQSGCCSVNKQNFWESSGFKIVISISMLVLVVYSKR